MKDSEALLVERAIQHDSAAFAQLYDRYVHRVYKHVYYRVATQADAEDITQEVFIRAWKAIGRYKPSGTRFRTWLITIAGNLVIDHYRAKKNVVSLDHAGALSSGPDEDPGALAEASFSKNRIRRAISKLKGDRQTVVMMRFIDEFSYGEIARAMKKSEGAVRVIQHRALKDLNRLLVQGE